jgi:hypothetical protein
MSTFRRQFFLHYDGKAHFFSFPLVPTKRTHDVVFTTKRLQRTDCIYNKKKTSFFYKNRKRSNNIVCFLFISELK